MTGPCEVCGIDGPLIQMTIGPADEFSQVCLRCLDPDGPEEDDLDEEEEEPDFTCGRCGGSGGGPEHWACPACSGSGTNRSARKAYYDDRRGDEEYDRWKDELP